MKTDILSCTTYLNVYAIYNRIVAVNTNYQINTHSQVSFSTYRTRGKIRWAKLLRFQPYEDFHGNTFAVHWPSVFITYLYSAIVKIHGKTFAVSSKTMKTAKV